MAAITLKQIRERHFGRSPSHIRQLIAKGDFPPPLNTGELGGPSLWDEETVVAWVSQFIKAAKARGPGGNRDRVASAIAARLAKVKRKRSNQGYSARRGA